MGALGISCAVIANLVYIVTIGADTFVPYFSAILHSFSYTFFGSAMWAAPGFVIPVHQLTTAYGLLNSATSCTITIGNISLGIIIDYYGYLLYLSLFIMVFVLMGLLSILLSVMEVASGNRKLNVSGKSRMMKS